MKIQRGIILVFIALLVSCAGSNRVVNKFIDNHKDNRGAIAMTIPGWLIHTGANFAEDFADEEDSKEYIRLGKFINRIRFLVLPNGHDIDQETIREFIYDAKMKDQYEEYVTVRDGDTNINVMMVEEEEVVKNLLLFIRSTDEMAIVTLNTDLPLNVLEDADFSFNINKK